MLVAKQHVDGEDEESANPANREERAVRVRSSHHDPSGDEHRFEGSRRPGAKAEFIRAQPAHLSVREVVELAAQQGLKLSPSQVYRLREPIVEAKSGPGRNGQQVSLRDSRARDEFLTTVERQLRNAIAKLGLLRSYEILEAIESELGVRYR